MARGDDGREAVEALEKRVETVVDRTNRSRRQLWRWMHERRADKSVGELQRGWTEAHLKGVVCGGWIETNDGAWQAKTC